MSGNNNFQIKLEVDDSSVKSAFQSTSKGLKQIEGNAKDVDKAIDNAFDTTEINKANKAIDKTSKELGQTTQELKALDNQGKKTAKSLNSSFRKVGRSISRVKGGLRGAFSRTGIGIFLVAIGTLISSFGDFKDTVLDALGPVGDFFRDAIDSTRDFLSTITFGLVDSTNAIAKALEENIKKVVEATELIAIQKKSILLERIKVQAEIEGKGAEEILAIQKKAGNARIEGLKKQLEQAEKESISFLSAAAIAEIDADNESNRRRKLELQEIAANERKKQAEAEKRAEELRLSIAKANLELLNIEKDFNTDVEAERKAAAERARAARDKRLEEEKRAAEQAKKEEEKRLAEELKLRLAFLVDEQTAREIRIQNQAEANKKLAQENIKDATILNAILVEIEKQKNEDIAQLRKDAADKELSEQRQKEQKLFNDKQSNLDNELQLEEAKLREQQILQRKNFNSVERTENDIAQFEAQQQRDREEQALRFEKRRLELVLEFGSLRTDAEIETTKQLIAALDAEIGELLDKPLTEGAGDGPQGGSYLQRLLGLDDEQLKALQDATQIAIGQINKLLDTRLQALDAEVDRRTERIGQLNTLLAAETALLQAGEAANVQSVKDRIEQEEKAREDALKKQRAAAIAKQTLDTVTQTSSLITASAQIFQSLSLLGPIGIPIAIGVIASMFAAFTAAQAQAFSAIEPVSLYTGGRIMNGEKDTNGGNGLKIEGTNARVGRGEWIVNATTSEKQNEFIKALNSGKYDNVDFMSMLGDGSMQKIALIERGAKRTINRKTNANLAKMYAREINKQTRILSTGLDDLYKKPQFIQTDKGFIERSIDKRGNTSTKKINLSQ